jgi:hypothetical protein
VPAAHQPQRGRDPDQRRAHRQHRQEPRHRAQQHRPRHARHPQAEGGQEALHQRRAQDAVDHAAHGRARHHDQPVGARPGDAVQQQAQPGGDRLAVQIEEERREQRQHEQQHAVGDAQQQADAALQHHAEIRPERLHHHRDVGRPAVPQRPQRRTQQRDAEHPVRRVRQAGAQRRLDDAAQVVHVPGAAGGGDRQRQHDRHRRQRHHQPGRHAAADMQAQAQPLEDRPGGEHQDGRPQQRRDERQQHDHAADRDATQQQRHQHPFGDHGPPSAGTAGCRRTCRGCARLVKLGVRG